MNTFKVVVPEGYEIDKEKSTFEQIVFKPVGSKYPIRIEEVVGRDWFINNSGLVYTARATNDPNQVSSEERAQAFLEMMQLVELRAAWNRVDGFEANWEDTWQIKCCVKNKRMELSIGNWTYVSSPLYFGSRETAQLFLDTFRDKIEIAKELI